MVPKTCFEYGMGRNCGDSISALSAESEVVGGFGFPRQAGFPSRGDAW